MFIPVVRRRVEVTTTGVVHLPFTCWNCQLSTTAHVKARGVGHANSAYIAPNQDAATTAANAALDRDARTTLGRCLCPRCGAPPESVLRAARDWDARHPDGKPKRNGMLLGIGLGATATLAFACVLSMVLHPTKGQTAAEMVSPAICGAMLIVLLGSLATLVVYLPSGGGKRPPVPTQNPDTVWFDPPAA